MECQPQAEIGSRSSSAAIATEDAREADGDSTVELPPPLTSSPTDDSHHADNVPPPLPHAASSSSLSNRLMECWICFDTRSTHANPIVTARCRCRGSVGFVHQKCIDRWVIQQHNRACRSCGAAYRLVHTEYPPDAYLPLQPKERRTFLLKYFVKPLAEEVFETVVCVLLRFVVVPLLLGLLYNYHRLGLLFWFLPGIGWLSGASSSGAPSNNTTNATNITTTAKATAWLLNTRGFASASTEQDTSTSAFFAAWADTFLFGLILCLVLNAVAVGSRKWDKFFRDARRELERAEAARQQQEEQQHADAAAAAAAALLDPLPAAMDEMDDEARPAEAEGNHDDDENMHAAPAGVVAPPFAHLVGPNAPLEGWRPEWGPIPFDHDFDADFAPYDLFPPLYGDGEGEMEGDWVQGGGMPYYHHHVGDAADFLGRGIDTADDGASTTTASDASTRGGASERAETTSSDDDDDDSSNDSGDADDEDAVPRLSFVDEVFDTVEWLRRGAGGGGYRRLTPKLLRQLRYGVVLTLLLRCPLGRLAIVVAFLVLLAGWRFRHTRNVLQTPKRRYAEVSERVPLLPQDGVRTLFVVYIIDAFFFYIALPELGAMTLHYALAPYLDIGMDGGVVNFVLGLTVWKLSVYWCIGAMLVMLLTAMELTVVSPLFAYGVELFFVRSFDARWDSVLGYWRCIVTQVYDSDPPRVVYGFLRVALVELAVLLIFVRLPFMGIYGLRSAIWDDEGVLAESASSMLQPAQRQQRMKMSFALTLDWSYDIPPDVTYEQWRQAEALRLFDDDVLMPFGEIYVKMIGSHPSMLEGRNTTAPIRMDPLVAAAMLVTNSTPAELWAYAWGNMSEHAAFVFDLVDPSGASRVAELSEGFRDTLARVRSPGEWLRHATVRGALCDTLTAMASPREWDGLASHRLPALEMEGMLRPPTVTLPDPSAAAARSRQMLFEAWQRAHTQASHYVQLVSRRDLLAASLGLSTEDLRWSPRPHTVNIVNCYVTTVQVVQPFVRLAGRPAMVLQWCFMLMLRNPVFNHGIACIVYLVATMTSLACFGVFPLQRAQLRLLQPYVRWVGRHVVKMEDYLFDPDLTRAVEDFVRTEFDEELVLPPMGDPTLFNRREDHMDDAAVPSHLVLRRIVTAVLFFAAAAVMVWTVPVLCGSLLLSVTTHALAVLLGTTLLSFFIWSPTLLGKAVMYGVVLSIGLLFAVPILFMIYVAPTLQMFYKCYPTLVEETFQRHYDVQQTVGPFNEPESDWYSTSWRSAEEREFARGVAAGGGWDDEGDDGDWEDLDFEEGEGEEAQPQEPPNAVAESEGDVDGTGREDADPVAAAATVD